MLPTLMWLALIGGDEWAGRFSPLGTNPLHEWALSYLVQPGMDRSTVERLLGQPDSSDTHGPPRESLTVHTYSGSGVTVRFDSTGRVVRVSR